MAPGSDTGGALKGVKILDLSRVLAGPYCTQILADYGADVIKVEDPGKGDDTRYWRAAGEGAAWKADAGPISNYFAAVNRNKRSVTLSLKHAKGKEAFLKLAEQADVVIENFRTGTMEKWGIGYDTLAQRNPRLIYASVTGYGPTGPFAHRAGYDMIAGAEAGLLHITGERGGPPVRPGLGLTDMSTGLYMHGAIMAALQARHRTGRGQKLDGSLFETQVSLLINVALSWLNLGQEAERWGTAHPSVVPYDAWRTKDSYLVIGATNDKQFKILCEKLGLPSLAEDRRFVTNEIRVKNRDALKTILLDLFAAKTTDEWVEVFEGSGMPYGPINSMERVFDHRQTEARNMVEKVSFDAAKAGAISLLGPPVKFSDTAATIRQRPALLGEHTEDVFREIGITGQELEDLKELKVI